MILYDNGWHEGTIAYYNKTIQGPKIDYQDKSIHYISPSEIWGAGVIQSYCQLSFSLSLSGVLKMFLLVGVFEENPDSYSS